MQDASKRLDTRMVNTSKAFMSCSRKPNFKSFTVYDRQLASIDMRPTVVTLRSPIAAGVVVLELSKLKMLSTWYGLLKKIYGQNIHLLLTDTDSFIVQILDCEDVFKTMQKNHMHFDMSNLPPPYRSETNSSTVGKLKDELAGKDVILGFVGLRSKCYCLKLLKQDEKKAKGLPRSVVKDIKFQDYYNALFSPVSAQSHEYHSIRSVGRTIFTLKEHRSGLANFDDKRVLCANRIETLPYFFDPAPVKRCERGQSAILDFCSTSNKMSNEILTVKVSERLSVNVSEFQGDIWYHMKDMKKSKNISVTSKDMDKLFKHKRDLIEAGKKVQQAVKKRKTKPKKRQKKKKARQEKLDGDLSSGSEYSSNTCNPSDSDD